MAALHAVVHAIVHVFQPKEYTVLIRTGDAVNHFVLTFDQRKLEMH